MNRLMPGWSAIVVDFVWNNHNSNNPIIHHHRFIFLLLGITNLHLREMQPVQKLKMKY
jgi:predicted nucleic acid-binding OB-fold protein